MDPDIGCCVCDAAEVHAEQAFVRGFNLGKHFADAEPEQRTEMLRRSLCLRHCHQLHEHQGWTDRNHGKPPPWPEEEPTVT